ncbi:MAG: DUF1801 domain-containing protein [Saprospiraceae bacterium]|nr:DUF1801 domain-containing protein [Saprospiraceae bacterium]
MAGKIEKLAEYLHMKLAKHKDFDSFLDDLTPEERSICLYLKDLLQGNFPALSVTWAYGVPYFRGRKRICFFYPASLPYSGITEGVNLGLVKGYLLSNDQQLINMGQRKEVGYIQIRRPNQIPSETLLEILHEAILLDNTK